VDRVAKEAADKEKKAKAEKAEAERVEKARVAQAAYEEGVRAIQADQRNLAKQTARINTQALAAKWCKLGKLKVRPNNPLMQVPKGPGPNNAEVQKICKDLVHQLKKRKLRDNEEIVVLADVTESVAGIAVSDPVIDFG
jgi:hypothetical protein